MLFTLLRNFSTQKILRIMTLQNIDSPFHFAENFTRTLFLNFKESAACPSSKFAATTRRIFAGTFISSMKMLTTRCKHSKLSTVAGTQADNLASSLSPSTAGKRRFVVSILVSKPSSSFCDSLKSSDRAQVSSTRSPARKAERAIFCTFSAIPVTLL